jgi:hypothetical protein
VTFLDDVTNILLLGGGGGGLASGGLRCLVGGFGRVGGLAAGSKGI